VNPVTWRPNLWATQIIAQVPKESYTKLLVESNSGSNPSWCYQVIAHMYNVVKWKGNWGSNDVHLHVRYHLHSQLPISRVWCQKCFGQWSAGMHQSTVSGGAYHGSTHRGDTVVVQLIFYIIAVLAGITGPDEFHPNVSNNAFTLVAVSLAIHWARYFSCMCQRNEREDVPDEYIKKALFLNLPYDNIQRLHYAFEGFNPGLFGFSYRMISLPKDVHNGNVQELGFIYHSDVNWSTNELNTTKNFTLRQGWNCRGVGGLNPQFMSTDAHFLSENRP